MTADAQARKLGSVAELWAGLADCTARGVYVYEQEAGQPVYRPYAELFLEARRLAGELANHGIGYGDQVLICAATNAAFSALWLALMWRGATPVPMPPRAALIGQYSFKERLAGILPHFRHYLCAADEIDEIAATAAECGSAVKILSFADILRSTLPDAASTPAATPPLDAAAFIQFTSGSTRAPKGIVVTYRNLFANVFEISSRLAYVPAHDRLISWLPLYHDMGLVGKFLSAIINRMDLILFPPQAFAKRPLRFLELIGMHQAQVCSMPNFALEWILRRLNNAASRDSEFSLASLKWFGVGAEPVLPHTLRAFDRAMRAYGLRDGVLSPCYGLAEATLAVAIDAPGTHYTFRDYDGRSYPSAGCVLDGIDVAIGFESQPTDVGRVRIRGDSIAQQALIDGKLQPLLDEAGYYDTKDIGELVDNRLFILGRADEMFIVNGENRFPYDIESAVRGVDGVLRNRVVCFHVALDVEAPAHGVVVLYESRPLPAPELERLRREIELAVRRRTGVELGIVVAVAPKSIPVTPSGKLQRLRARKLYVEGFYQSVAARARVTYGGNPAAMEAE